MATKVELQDQVEQLEALLEEALEPLRWMAAALSWTLSVLSRFIQSQT